MSKPIGGDQKPQTPHERKPNTSGEIGGHKVSLWTKVPGLQKFVNFIGRVFGRSSGRSDAPSMEKRANVVGKSTPEVRRGATAVQQAVSPKQPTVTPLIALQKLDVLGKDLEEKGYITGYSHLLPVKEKLAIVEKAVSEAASKIHAHSPKDRVRQAEDWTAQYLLILDSLPRDKYPIE